ncbi:MAG: hypothetical protein HZA90_02060 [Verrucomicrobia bacterium]|nr:hypothetical protein [Verrucomicrobiota bacterium]
MNPKPLLLLALALILPLASARAALITTNTALSPGDTTYEGAALIVSNCTLTVNGAHSFASLLLTDGAVLTHSPAPAGETNNRLDLAIAGELTIDATSRVDVNAKGYGSAAGSSAGTNDYYNASGGGHGGPGGNAYGGIAGGVSYGDLLAPTQGGSGGGNLGDSPGPGGAGGGVIRLNVGGTFTVAGQLSANGEGTYDSGGAGGSIHIIAGTLAGSGSITANGGSAGYAQSGGGGGGRIALYYGNSTFSGGLMALGGLSTSANCGGVGTLYTKANSQSVGDLLLDNSGRTNAMETPITAPVAYRLTLTNATAYVTEPLTLNSLRVGANGLLTHLPTQLPGLDLTVSGDVTIDAGGAISADRKGYGQVAGPGAGTNDYYYASGGGHGGLGGSGYGQMGGGSYGALLAPTAWGSGGGSMPTCGGQCRGGFGGGRVRLSVGGVLTVAGQLTANGESVWAGGGAGGSVYVIAGALTGNGSIAANGGSAGYVLSGGGGGGRIALYYGNSTFSGALTALGGFSTSANSGGAGTLYTKANSQSVGDLLVDNSGRTNATETPLTTPVAYRLALTNATAYATEPLTLTGLRVRANGLLTHAFQGPRLQVLVQGSALVEGGGAIAADARGYPGQTGPGRGLWLGGYYGQGAGAGHGGQGGGCWSGPGGVTYDSETEPVEFGSGGGGGAAPNRGGGAIQLTVAGTLTIDGRVSVNADAVTGGYDGGGSGGSVWLTASRLNGSGTITANGQVAGYPGSGSGGGGRIAIYTGVNQFAGTVAASGGQGGLQNGSGGSLYYSTNVSPPLAGTANVFSTQFEAIEGYRTATNLVGQNGWLGLGSGGNGVVSNYFVGQGQQAFIGFFPSSSPPATTNIFSTQFEVTEGYLTATDLAGQNGWLSGGSGGNGVVSNYFMGQGQQAFIGFFPPNPGSDGLTVWRPINFSPIPTNMPVVQFSVLMSIVDSSNTNYDDFYWSVYNAQSNRLFTLDFDNYSRRIYYQLDGTNNWVWTGQTFANDDTSTLVITMNFIQNSWSATFGGVLLGENKPITTTGAPLNLGDVDARWRVVAPALPGDNYMVFDNYQITAEVLPPDQGDGQLTVWRPINFSPIPTNMPVVQFSVLMSIVDSSNTRYDDFYWNVCNAQGDRLFTLDFDNYTRRIYYQLDGTNNWVWTGQTFANDDTNTLVITMDFIQNYWSATFGGVPLGKNKRITTTGTPLNLGHVDAVWTMYDPAHPGDNYMLFDNYQITAEVLPPVSPPVTTNTFFTQFEVPEGYRTATDLVGQNGWLGSGSGGNGVVSNYFVGQGQQAFIGYFPPDQGADRLTVWRPINFSPIPTNMPVVQFSVLMSIVDSSNTNYDDFYWSVYNAQGDRLFTLDFDNYRRRIYYQLDGTNNWVWTGQTFANDDTNTLVITMNFIQNSWSATFGGVLLGENEPITTTGAPLNLGDVDAVWAVFDPAYPGDNYMLFDNYQITAEVLPPPMVIAQYPSGSVNRFVSYVDVTFNQPVDPATFTTSDLVLTAPSGPIPASQITLSGGGGVTWRIGFPTQFANGAYSFNVGPHIANLFGQELETNYSGGFTVNFTTPTTTASQTGGNLSLIWSSATGLSYQLQSTTNLPATSWFSEGTPLNGTGGLLTNTVSIGSEPARFFRLQLLEN